MSTNFAQQPVPGSVSVAHVIAILCTIFRLVYRCWIHHLWWEDAWAAFALISDVICMLCIWIQTSASFPIWTFSATSSSVVWAARMSIIFSIIRIANPSGYNYQKWTTYLIAISFVCMWVAIMIQKNITCVFVCHTTKSVALLQMITDVIADVSLIAAPLQFWKNVRLSRNSKILIFSTFGASFIISIITITHSTMLFHSASETTLIIAHVKAALSLVICNLLVIVTLVYRVRWKEALDPDETFGSPLVFTSVVAVQTPASAIPMTSHTVHEGTARVD
ncbi:hypothetical protein DFJ58DRAFT_279581 [Suillus subalutaceus]|uniref:uncharacterized protein n=1 Tax=Suillus subalutaceus TaxID=48586 RepID=UPI001B8656BF|nr:uncharacterized protein DFJ58DRAFT_279581 [Suillus subalutaceus]KAG1860163.1 hypothetical protein DFJ58DRAFT_279581 [Suillus subalutaceus]